MKTIIIFFLAVLVSFNIMAQSQAESFIKEAQDFLAKKEYKEAQLSLQDAINDINMLLAKDIANSMPMEINGLKKDGEADVNTGAMGIVGGGMSITQRYKNEKDNNNTAEVQILANSPLLSTLSMYMGNPSMMGKDYKSVRIGSQRAILKSEMEDANDDSGKQVRSSEIQIPLNRTLITINAEGFATEQAELDFANKLDLAKLKTALGE